MSLRVVPLTLKQANDLISRMHRHHKPVQGHRFSLGLVSDDWHEPIGACVVGRPVSREIDPYLVAEVTRLVTDGTKNGCSILYAAAARSCEAMGFHKIQTYILGSSALIRAGATGTILRLMLERGGQISQ